MARGYESPEHSQNKHLDVVGNRRSYSSGTSIEMAVCPFRDETAKYRRLDLLLHPRCYRDQSLSECPWLLTGTRFRLGALTAVPRVPGNQCREN